MRRWRHRGGPGAALERSPNRCKSYFSIMSLSTQTAKWLGTVGVFQELTGECGAKLRDAAIHDGWFTPARLIPTPIAVNTLFGVGYCTRTSI